MVGQPMTAGSSVPRADQALTRDSSRAPSRELCMERCQPFGAGRPATTRHVRMATIIAGIADFELELIQGRIRDRRRKGPREVLAANLIAHPNRIDLHPWSSHWSAKWRSAARLGQSCLHRRAFEDLQHVRHAIHPVHHHVFNWRPAREWGALDSPM
jgi:hypothetical protein